MKLKQRISDWSIKKKMMASAYLVVAPILLIISVVMFVHNYTKTVEDQNDRSLNRVQSLDTSLAELNQSVSEMSTYICINNDILRILRTSEPEEIRRLNAKSQLWLEDAPLRFILDTLAIKGFIKTLGIYPENGVSPYLRCMDSSAYLSTIEEVRETDMYQEAVAKKGTRCWKLIEKDSTTELFWANKEDKIVVYREIYDLSQKKPLGYLAIGADAGKYEELCSAILERDNEGIIVLNAGGEILISCGEVSEETEKDFTEENVLAQLAAKESGFFDYGGSTVYFTSNKQSGQRACILIPKSNVNEQVAALAYTPVLMLIGVLIGLFPVLTVISNVVIKPLSKVNRAMAEFKKGDFGQQVQVESRDEVGEVALCFNQMVKDIKLLIDEKYVMELRERESELTALQAQINPHFLYNTLDSLYWQAEEADNEEIAENILALSNLFRQVLGEGKGITTVSQECRLVKEYLTVQKMRFTKRLKYEIEIEPEIEDEKIPKLILQPFVENAVVHGFENTDSPCEIFVRCSKIPGGLEFVVADTGVGMTKKQVESILAMDDTERYKGQRVGRYAIKNVKERLTLMYRGNFQMLVDSEPGKGTRITIRIFSGETEKTGGEEHGKETSDCR